MKSQLGLFADAERATVARMSNEQPPGGAPASPAQASPVRATPNPKRGRAVAAPPQAQPLDVGGFGPVPAGITHWAIYRREGETSMRQSWMSPGEAMAKTEWPIAELSPETIRERWGDGVYQIAWFAPDPESGVLRKKNMGPQRVFPRLHAAAPAPAAPSAAPAGLPGEWGAAFALMNAIESRADSQLEGLAKLASIMAPRQSAGLDATVLTLLLDKQANTMKEAIAPLAQSVASLTAKVAELENGDAEPSAIGGAVAAAAPLISKSGKGWANAVVGFAQSNPDVVSTVLSKGLDVVGKVAEAIKVAATPPATPAPKPRAIARPQLPEPSAYPGHSEPEAPPPPPPGPGLNGFMREAQRKAPTEPAPSVAGGEA